MLLVSEKREGKPNNEVVRAASGAVALAQRAQLKERFENEALPLLDTIYALSLIHI